MSKFIWQYLYIDVSESMLRKGFRVKFIIFAYLSTLLLSCIDSGSVVVVVVMLVVS